MVNIGNSRSGLELNTVGRTPGAAACGTGRRKRKGCIEWLFKCLLFLGEVAAQATDSSHGPSESAPFCPNTLPKHR